MLPLNLMLEPQLRTALLFPEPVPRFGARVCRRFLTVALVMASVPALHVAPALPFEPGSLRTGCPTRRDSRSPGGCSRRRGSRRDRAPLRVCEVVGYDLAEPGGVKHHAVQLARALRAGGDQVTVIGPSSRPSSDPDQRGFRGVVKVSSSSSGSNSSIGMFVEPWRVAAFFRRNPFDVVHVHEPLLPSLAYYATWSSPASAHVGTFHSFTEAPSRRLRTFGRVAAAVQAPRGRPCVLLA